ncbi:MAG: protein translocase subunit SecD [Clostridia bacterium]|nr:protein translocase subunit SecD [Clostridia bacterium]
MNYSRTASLVKFILLVLCIVMVCSVAVCGVYFSEDKQIKGIFDEDAVTLGLDLAGGSVITYRAKTNDSGDTLDVGMNSIVTVMRDRLDNQGLTEALCYRAGDDMVTVEIPAVDDPNEAIKSFMQTAKLTFRDSSGNVILEGKHVINATAGTQTNQSTNEREIGVSLELNDEGAQLFAEATKKAATNGTRIGIYIDENLISNPSVGSEYASTGITGGKAWISGSFKEGIEAERLAGNINAGALRYEMEVVEQRTVGATLGANSLSRSLIAGGIGLLLVIIFMCVYYRLSGIMASVALIGYCGLFALALMMFNTNLTLAGIAGVVLSIGMAVDANVVIFERMKEELDSGKSVKAAIKGGFHRAFWAIFDSNVTTLIACGVLLALGSGTIKGFATTLLIGVVLSLFTALVVTRGLLYLGVGMGLNNPASYRSLGKKNAEKTGRFHFVNNRKVTLVILACVLVVGVIAFFVRGTNIDIDFSGGTEIQIDVGTEVTDSVCNRINEIIENEPTLGHSYVSSTSQSAASSTTAIIRTGTSALTTDQEIALENALVAEYPDTDTHNAQITTIQPTIGSALTKKAVLAVAIAVILMLAYIWFRFELNSGLAAICCLVHDLFIMLAIYSIFLIPINSNIIAAFLTILGYSINATIIVFDRIRENRTKLGDEAEFGDIVNKSVHETLGRSINTTITTLLTIGMIWIMGVDAIRNFALPLIIGIVAGLFSSVFISGMLWDRLNKLFKPRKKDGKKAAKEEKKDTAKA